MRSHHDIFDNGKFYIYLLTEQIISIWNNAVHCMNFRVHTAGMYRATTIPGRVHTAFFNYYYLSEMTNMPDEPVLASIMTALDLELERVLHFHDEGYDSDNDHGIPGPVMRPVCIYLVSTIEASFSPIDYKGAQYPTSPFTPR